MRTVDGAIDIPSTRSTTPPQQLCGCLQQRPPSVRLYSMAQPGHLPQLVNSPPKRSDEPEDGVEDVLLNAGCTNRFSMSWPIGPSSSSNAVNGLKSLLSWVTA